MAPGDPLPGGQKLSYCVSPIFHKNCNILRMLCQNKLKFCILARFGVLNLNLMLERDECERKSCYFDISVRLTTYGNCQKWSINNIVLGMWQS